MKFKLAEKFTLEEDVLNENTYGMTRKQSRRDLEATLTSERMLDIIINGQPMDNGFTLKSNNWGMGVQAETNLPFIMHHMELSREQQSALDMLFNSNEHNNIHKDIRELIKNVMIKYSKDILQSAYNEYVTQYRDADKLIKSNTDAYYQVIGNKLKAYEDYFRNVRDKLYQQCDTSFVGSEIDRLISMYNTFSGITKLATDGNIRKEINKEN